MTAKTIIITGAGSGIGRATARRFLDEGWTVGLIGRREEPLLETAGSAPGALTLPCDVTSPDQVAHAFRTFTEQAGRLDVLFNNAGTNVPAATIDEITPEQWRQVMEVNISGTFLAARAAFATMRAQDPQGGRIINNGSVSARTPRPGSAPYTLSKHAVTGLTKTLALDGRPFGIGCGQIDIGNALTDLSKRMKTGVIQADGSKRPEAMMDVSAVADTVLHMASLPPEANIPFVTVMATNMPLFGRG